MKSLKLEGFAEMGGKSQAKLERTDRSWKEPTEVGKFFLSWKVSPKLESFDEVGKLSLKLESATALNKFIIKQFIFKKLNI